MELTLSRTYYPNGTNGKLSFADNFICDTIELPWQDNAVSRSCIPEGRYRVRKRFSKRFNSHLEIIDVPRRKYILFHPANVASYELRGCIAPVDKITGPGSGLLSRQAFYRLMNFVNKEIELNKEVWLTIERSV